jgi:hypothetical protein
MIRMFRFCSFVPVYPPPFRAVVGLPGTAAAQVVVVVVVVIVVVSGEAVGSEYLTSPRCMNPAYYTDLAKSLLALDERDDLLKDYEASNSVLEIIFLYVGVFRLVFSRYHTTLDGVLS